MRVYRKKESYLCHHGIKGQHWGVKNGPPYPLDIRVSRQIKAGKNEDRHKGHKVGVQHSAAASGTFYSRSRDAVNRMSWEEFDKQPSSFKALFRDTDLGLRDVNRFEYGDGSWHYANPLEHDDVSTLLSSNFKDGQFSQSPFYTIDKTVKHDIRENGWQNYTDLLKNINRGEKNSDTMNNCSKCTDMVELVQRGLNPNNFSAGRSKYGMLSSALAYHWDGAVQYKEKSHDNIERKIKSFGNHASGAISIRRADGSGHAMHFTVVKGRVEVQDGQVGKVYANISEALRAEAHDPDQFCTITRLDQARPNVKHMLEDSVIRMDGAQSDRWKTGVSYTEGKVWTGYKDSMSSVLDDEDEIEDSKRNAYNDSKRNFRYRG